MCVAAILLSERTGERSMEPETLEALKGSIKKWEAIVAGPEPSHDIGPNACPLCAKFNWVVNLDVPQGCRGCPVQESTGNYGCIGTPYQDYEDAEGDDDPERMFLHAQREVDFLKSLLPQASEAGESK